MPMLDWLKKRGSVPMREPDDDDDEIARPRGRAMSGRYVLLYKYLENRYAQTVVLTFAEIEDLLGFTLPDQAGLEPEWWTATDAAVPNYSDSWVLASRTAVPNLAARIVIFERTA